MRRPARRLARPRASAPAPMDSTAREPVVMYVRAARYAIARPAAPLKRVFRVARSSGDSRAPWDVKSVNDHRRNHRQGDRKPGKGQHRPRCPLGRLVNSPPRVGGLSEWQVSHPRPPLIITDAQPDQITWPSPTPYLHPPYRNSPGLVETQLFESGIFGRSFSTIKHPSPICWPSLITNRQKPRGPVGGSPRHEI